MSASEFSDLLRAASEAVRGCSGISLELLAYTPLPPTLLAWTALAEPTEWPAPERDTHDEWREINGRR